MNTKDTISGRVLWWLAPAIIFLGVALRIKVLLDNRCLWIDEASVARNVYERGFVALLSPLDYYQYAPPGYLWLVKLSAVAFGYSELALRLYSVLAGIGCLVILYKIVREEVGLWPALYPLFLMATGFIFIRYSTELKQYVPDMFISEGLLYMALKFSIEDVSIKKFATIWVLVGSIVIWSSMPSVFVLAGVGVYYGVVSLQRNKMRLLPLLLIAIVWGGQFLCYYLLILKPQIHSDYLQGYHQRFFLFAIPGNIEEWKHNKDVCLAILKVAGGDTWYAITFNLGVFITGTFYLLRTSIARAALFLVPILLMLIAAAINQYSLIPRLTLFSMPMLYSVIAYGIFRLIQIRVLKYGIAIIAVVCACIYQSLALFTQPFEQEEITRGLDYLTQKHVSSKDLYVVVGAEHAFLYYTEMHPGRQRWQTLKGAHLLPGGIDYDSLGKSIGGKPAFLYTIVFDSFDGKKKLEHNMQLTDSFHTEGCYVFIYKKK